MADAIEAWHFYTTIGVFVFTAFTLVGLQFIDAPYGKQNQQAQSPLWGPIVPTRLSWFLMEAPVFFSFGIFYFLGDNWQKPIPLLLFALWQGHYFHRTFIYPRTLQGQKNEGFHLTVLLIGMVLNSANGFINGWYISQYGQHLYNVQWLASPQFIIGMGLFIAGFTLAKTTDYQLSRLRTPNDNSYKIPYGYGFKWVSNPHYLGELTQWLGFAIACWSLPALAFVCITLSNLLPRALSNHKWYHKNFENYPANRKALIPYIL